MATFSPGPRTPTAIPSLILGALTAADSTYRKLPGMAAYDTTHLPVRLGPPYPDLATLGGDSEISLLVAAGADSTRIEELLGRIGADRVVPGEGGVLLAAGTLGRLLAGVRDDPTHGAGSTIGVALRDLLTHLKGPAPSLRVGGQVWDFGRRTYLVGIVNVTPDSFSGDGVGRDPAAAAELAHRLVTEGADAIDLGGESTRPGHAEVEEGEEIERVLPALKLIAGEVGVPVFVDTSKAAVARAALAGGADGINDVWGLRRDPEMAGVVAAAQVPVICMHNQIGHEYSDLMGDLLSHLQGSLHLAQTGGIPRDQVLIDPGIGFGKTPAQNYEVLRRLIELRTLGCPVLVGTSRKSLISWVLDDRPVDGRLLGTAATVAWSVASGADVVRVHDVAQMRDVVRVMDVMARRPPS
ncbi:MAG: dihydropteroate synthase [Candidatus Dormiibacterota bacterium]